MSGAYAFEHTFRSTSASAESESKSESVTPAESVSTSEGLRLSAAANLTAGQYLSTLIPPCNIPHWNRLVATPAWSLTPFLSAPHPDSSSSPGSSTGTGTGTGTGTAGPGTKTGTVPPRFSAKHILDRVAGNASTRAYLRQRIEERERRERGKCEVRRELCDMPAAEGDAVGMGDETDTQLLLDRAHLSSDPRRPYCGYHDVYRQHQQAEGFADGEGWIRFERMSFGSASSSGSSSTSSSASGSTSTGTTESESSRSRSRPTWKISLLPSADVFRAVPALPTSPLSANASRTPPHPLTEAERHILDAETRFWQEQDRSRSSCSSPSSSFSSTNDPFADFSGIHAHHPEDQDEDVDVDVSMINISP